MSNNDLAQNVRTCNPLLETALRYAAQGLPVFPVWWTIGGACACPKGASCGRNTGKHPLTPRGLNDASTDPNQIRRWFEIAPLANVGIAIPDGLVVVDPDRHNPEADGFATLAALAAEGRSLPPTRTAATGGGGAHLWFRVPPGLTLPGTLGLGVDVKQRGGYVVAPPSVHASGACYQWIDPDAPIANAPAWLVALGRPRGEATAVVIDEDEAPAQPDETIDAVVAAIAPHYTDGRKHHLAFTLGAWLRGRGFNAGDVARVIERLPSRAAQARVKDARDGYRATGTQGWTKLCELVGEGPANELDAGTPNPRREEAAWVLPTMAAAVPMPAPTASTIVDTSASAPAPAETLPPFPAQIVYSEQQEHSAIDKAIGALANSESVYQRGGLLVHVARDLSPRRGVRRDRDAPRIAEMQQARLRDELSRHTAWLTPSMKPIGVPPRVVEGVRARNEWRDIRALRGLGEFPIVRDDGAIVSTEGYDEATGVYVAPSCPVELWSDTPAAALAQWLLDEIVGDFPFATPGHRSAWLSALLTPLARYAFDGPTPLMLIDKNVRGSGGSLLADLIGLVCTGRPLPRMSQALDETEENKRLLGLAVAGDPVVLIDNVNHPLGNGGLDRALTGTTIKDRWLGENKSVTAPWNCMLVATGNNMQLVGDTMRRALPVRLESPEERPEERAGFRHADVRAWALANRGRLLGAALGILSSHLRAGGVNLKPWGSFEGWSEVVRGAVVACGLADPCAGRDELVACDSDADTARALVLGVAALGATSEATARPVKDLLGATTAVPLPPELEGLRDALALVTLGQGGRPEMLNAHRAGNALRRYRGRVVGGRKLLSTDPRRTSGQARWYVAT